MQYRFSRSLLVVVLFIICCHINAYAENFSPELDEKFQYAVQEGNVWIVVDGEVTIYDEELREVIDTIFVDVVNYHISLNSDIAYWVYDDEEFECIMQIDTDGKIMWERALQRDISIMQIEAYSGGAVFLASHSEDDDVDEHGNIGNVYVVSENGDIRDFYGVGNVSGIACDDKYLCAYSIAYDEINIYDIESGTIINSLQVSGVQYFDVFDEYIYALKYTVDGAVVCRIDIEDGSSRIILEIEYNAVGLRIGNGCMYICDIDASKLCGYEIPNVEKGGTILKVVMDSPGTAESERMRRTMEMTIAEYPDVEFEFVYEPNDTRLLTTIMSNEEGYDVVFIQEASGVSARNFYQAGALADLSKSPVVMEKYNRLIDMDGIFVFGGSIFAVPQVVYPYAFQVNIPLFEEYGLDVPDASWTWNDFFELSDSVVKLRDEGENIILLADGDIPFFLMQYNINELTRGRINYENPLFIDYLDKWRTGIIEGSIEHTDYMYIFGCKDNALFTVKMLSYSDMEDGIFVQPPKYADYVKIPVYTLSVGIISSSDNMDVAECFISNYISNDVLELPEHYYVYGSLLEDDSNVKYPVFAQQFFPTIENKEFWIDSLENGIQYIMIDEFMYAQYGDLYWDYINGNIGISEFVLDSQQKADMAIGE